jgi:hypothetical protein
MLNSSSITPSISCLSNSSVFFCGAGVSKNTAEKPDFIQLAKAIVDKLTSNPESQSRKNLGQLKEIAENYSVIMPIDHLKLTYPQ